MLDDTASAIGNPSRIGQFRSAGVTLTVFTGTIFLSALLLFSVQPMFAKMVLPKLGGSPSVWAVSMCFFQAALLGGYCYAHALNRFVPARLAPVFHIALLGIALLALPIGLPSRAAEPPAGDAYLWLVGTLALGVGLPFFAVSANAPLLQSWFARSGHPHAADPYFLYAASNLGSLIALLAYPLVLEPSAGVAMQAAIWTGGFVALAVSIALCGWLIADRFSGATAIAGTVTLPSADAPSWNERARWVGLAFVPSGLLVAFSTYVTTDIASAPFLWVLPLAAFLLTFILVFRDKPLIPHRPLLMAQPVLVAFAILGLATSGDIGRTIANFATTGSFFVTMMIAHRELYDRRPVPQNLTEFYLWMSLGGVLGGVFAALLAPQIFSTTWELPLLLVLGMACRPGFFAGAPERGCQESLFFGVAAVAGIAGVAIAMQVGGMDPANTLTRFVAIVGCGILAAISVSRPIRQFVALAVTFAALALLPSEMSRGISERSFFGVHRVETSFDNQMHYLLHGTTIHGAQRVRYPDGKPVARPVPATYYYPAGPMALGVSASRIASGKPAGGLRVGIVGLGAGSMACHSRPDESWRFFEIDPVVVRIARDPSKFTFLSACRPDADIVIGDARLTLAKAPAASFDYLVIDAFSSDSVPVHLLTTEALRLYLSKLADKGILALHVSNRHMNLVDVVASLVEAVPGAHAKLADDVVKPGLIDASSHVVFIAQSAATLDALSDLRFIKPMPKAEVEPWTDDYSDVITAIRRRKARAAQ